MPVNQSSHQIRTHGKGFYELTGKLAETLGKAGIEEGIATAFCAHTSCSLVLMENADPSAREDLEAFFERLVAEDDPHFTHTLEGRDDMPSHIRMALTRSSETIPVSGGRLQLGTWQGLFLWEHRRAPHTRTVYFTVLGD